jgi:hypothetical protein
VVTSGVKQQNSDEPPKLIDAVISEIGGALFPDNPHAWLDHFSRKVKALTEEPESSDSRLWWTIHGQEIGTATDVKLAIRYLVLAIQPGLEEFRGIYISGGLGDKLTAEQVCRSLHVPKRRGAVNWMTDCVRKLEEGGSKRKVLTLFDAWMDLRGHAASEDLILGNRSVAGFPLHLPKHKDLRGAQTGYFFLSHPMPGLFYEDKKHTPIKGFLGTLQDIRERYEDALAMAVDMDMFTEFTARTGPRRVANPVPVTLGSATESLVDLSADDPAGYVATVLLHAGSGHPQFAINEGAFARELWSNAALLSFFPHDWQVLTSSMEAYSRDFKGKGDCISPFWDPQEHSEDEEQRWDSVRSYYPADVIVPLVSVPKSSPNRIDTCLHKRFNIFRKLYSSIHDPHRDRGPQADLVIPLGCGPNDINEPSRIAGFIRVNCDALPRHKTIQYQQLYRLVTDLHAERLNNSLGRLLLLADSDLRWIHGRKNAGLFKQAYDAVRQLADWSAKCLAARGVLATGGDKTSEPTSAPFSEALLQNVMANVWMRISKEGKSDVDETRRSVLLRESFRSIHEFASLLSAETGVPFTLVTFWLQVWTPTIDSISGDSDEFVALTMSDPGLLDVLQHLVLIRKPGGIDLCNPRKREFNSGEGLLDLGYPHLAAGLDSLRVDLTSHDTMRISWNTPTTDSSVSLRWTTPPDSTSPARQIPAALAVVDGAVSDRISRNIAESGLIRIARNYTSLADSLSLEDTVSCVHGGSPEAIRRLQELFTDKSPELACPWTVLPLKRSDNSPAISAHLCVLAPHGVSDGGRPIMRAARNLSLSEAIAKYRALRIAAERKFARDQAALDHQFIGPAGQLVPALMTVKALLGRTGRPTESSEVRLETAKRNAHDAENKLELVLEKLAKMQLLARDSIYFSNGQCIPTSINGDDFSQHVAATIGTHDDPFESLIENTVTPAAFAGATATYDPRIFRHGLGNLVRNAVKHRYPTSDIRVSAECRGATCYLRVANRVANAESAMNDIESARSGIGDQHGVNESYRSFEELLYLKLRYVVQDEILTAEVAIPLSGK